jgi:DNA-binding FadR family transcriptional regulator
VALHDAVRTAIIGREPEAAAAAMARLLEASHARLLPLTTEPRT